MHLNSLLDSSFRCCTLSNVRIVTVHSNSIWLSSGSSVWPRGSGRYAKQEPRMKWREGEGESRRMEVSIRHCSSGIYAEGTPTKYRQWHPSSSHLINNPPTMSGLTVTLSWLTTTWKFLTMQLGYYRGYAGPNCGDGSMMQVWFFNDVCDRISLVIMCLGNWLMSLLVWMVIKSYREMDASHESIVVKIKKFYLNRRLWLETRRFEWS